MNKVRFTIFSCITAVISFLLLFFTEYDYNYYGAQGVYRIYLNGNSIGLIKNPDTLKKYINNEQEQLKKKYNVDNVYAPSGLEIKQELTYNEKLKTAKEIYDEIKDIEPFTIKGYTITIYSKEHTIETDEESGDIVTKDNDELIYDRIYTLNKEMFLEAINNTIYTFIDEDSYQAYINEEQPEVKEMDEGIIISNVHLKEDVYIKQDFISVDENIFTDKKLLSKYLLYGKTTDEKTYTVQIGDTVSEIADRNKLNVREFLIANKDVSSAETLLYPGQSVVVDIINPMITVVEDSVETQYQEKKYKTEIIEDTSFYVGYTQVIQAGVNGEELVTMRIQRENGKIVNAIATNTIETKAPINRVVKTGSRTEFVVGNTGIWAWPTRSGYRISTYFGWDSGTYSYTRYHEAIDITGTGCGSPIYAANDGTVINAKWNNSLGYYVEINHNNGYVTLYAHMTKYYVAKGQAVEMGQIIGLMGSTGESTGCHLHFVASYNGRKFNPLQLY